MHIPFNLLVHVNVLHEAVVLHDLLQPDVAVPSVVDVEVLREDDFREVGTSLYEGFAMNG